MERNQTGTFDLLIAISFMRVNVLPPIFASLPQVTHTRHIDKANAT